MKFQKFVLTLIAFFLLYLNLQCDFMPKREEITVGMHQYEYATLIYIAQDKGYFADNGLNVSIRDYETGSLAIKNMIKGGIDISLSTEYTVVIEALKKENISVIGSIDNFQGWFIFGRKDRGIEKISNLKGKRIGVARETIGEFFLGRSLNLHKLSLKDVILVNTPFSQSTQAIADGIVDAIIVVQSYVDPIKERLKNNAVVWPAQKNQLIYSVLACRNDWIARRQEQIRRFLRSLAEAEVYLVRHPNEVKAILKRKLNYDDKYISSIWTQHYFRLSLDFSLFVTMNDEARWMISSRLTPEKQVPDFLDFIYPDGLKAVKPKAVNISPGR